MSYGLKCVLSGNRKNWPRQLAFNKFAASLLKPGIEWKACIKIFTSIDDTGDVAIVAGIIKADIGLN